MIIGIKSTLGECLYALGEAKVNTELAIKYEERLDIKNQLEQDYAYFCDLENKVRDKLDAMRLQRVVED